MSLFSSPLSFLVWLLGSSSCTVLEQRPFERKAEEDDGKVSFWMADWFPVWTPLAVASVSSQAALWFESTTSTRVGFRQWESLLLHLNRRHPEDGAWKSVSPWRQAERQTRVPLLSCLLSPHPTPPPPCPHTKLRHPPCCRSALEPASGTVCPVKPRLKLCVYGNQVFTSCQATAGLRYESKSSS